MSSDRRATKQVSRQGGEPRWKGTPKRFSTHPSSRLDELLPDRWKALRESAESGDLRLTDRELILASFLSDVASRRCSLGSSP